jgi:hypothetical protein
MMMTVMVLLVKETMTMAVVTVVLAAILTMETATEMATIITWKKMSKNENRKKE